MEDIARLESIAENQRNLDQFGVQIQRNEEIGQKMITTLTSFDDRLLRLEETIIPIYSSTQRYDRIDKNVGKTLEFVREIISYMDLVEEEDLNINRGPIEEDIDAYLATIGRIKSALDSLLEMNLPNLDKTLNQLRNLYKKGISKVDAVFKSWLSSQTNVIDPKSVSARKGQTGFLLAPDSVKKISRLSQVLSKTKDRAVPSQYQEIYAEVRSAYLDKSLQALSNDCLKAANVGSGGVGKTSHKPLFFEKGKHPYMSYTDYFIQLCVAEKTNIQAVFIESDHSPTDVVNVFLKTIRPALLSYLNTGDLILRAKSNNINCKDFSEILELLDLSGFLSAVVSDHEDVFASSNGKLFPEIAELLSKYENAALQSLPSYIKDLEKPANRYPSVPVDCTVHEISTDTINFLGKLDNYQEIAESILEKLHFGSYQDFCIHVLKLLNDAIIKLSGLYKEDLKGIIFALNNNYYILKALKKGNAKNLPQSILDKYNTGVSSILAKFLQEWDKVIVPCKNLTLNYSTKSDKAPIKDNCKNFITNFEDQLKLQKNLAIPDYELRMNLITELKDLVVPAYTRFHDRYRAMPFTKKYTKYFKYDPSSVEQSLGGLFES